MRQFPKIFTKIKLFSKILNSKKLDFEKSTRAMFTVIQEAGLEFTTCIP